MSGENKYDAKKEWNSLFLNAGMSFPSEYVIRILKGSFPRLNLDKAAFRGSRFCDAGCGDGRNLLLAKTCGFDTFGVEISEEIVAKVRSNLSKAGIEQVDVRVGSNSKIPFGDEFFDYLLSWNACYYMGGVLDFDAYVREFARVLRKDGYLILSIPKKSCFIFKTSEPAGKEGYRIIRNDPFKVRDGEILRMFNDEKEIEAVFSPFFKDFIFASIHDDCFGYEYHWHLAVCKRK